MPECESFENAKYNEDWTRFALPGSVSENSGKFTPDLCERFLYSGRNRTDSNETCAAEFIATSKERCDTWVFDEGERTIVNDVSVFVIK